MKQDTPESAPSLFNQSNREIFQGSSLGVVESTIDRRVVFANKAALKMLGADSYEGLSLDAVFAGAAAQGLLKEQLEERERGNLGNYKTWLSRLDDPTKQVPVDITALPLYDGAGKVVGSIGIFRSLEQERLIGEQERLTSEIRELTLKHKKRHSLLDAVSERVGKLLPYDLLLVSRMNPIDRETETYYTFPRFEQRLPRVWFSLNKAQWEYMCRDTSVIEDFEKVMSNEPWASYHNEPMVVRMREIGLQTTMFRVIRRGDPAKGKANGEPIASIALMSRRKDAYSERERKLFDALPLTEAVLRAMDNDARRIEEGKLDLLKKLNRCATLDEAGRVLATKLLELFDWSHVAVYRVDYSAEFVRLLHGESKDRGNGGERKKLDPEYKQHITAGVFGQVIHSGEARNIPDVKKEIAYLVGPNREDVLSELACPIRFDPDNHVRFIINLNDNRYNAFSKADERMLGELADEVAGAMQRISHVAFLAECFGQASDPIIATDARLRIRKVNPAAASMMGIESPAAAVGSISDYFDTPDAFEQVKSGKESGQLGELALKGAGGNRQLARTAHVTWRQFPQSLGGYVFVARDLHDVREQVEVELLEKAAYEIAMETRTPLTLAMAQLEKLSKGREDMEKPVAEILKMLGRVKNAYTRLAMFNVRARDDPESFIPLSLSGELRALIASLTDEEAAKILVSIEDEPLEIDGDHNQLATVFGTVLSVLLRSAPESGQVAVGLRGEGTAAIVRMEGQVAAPEGRRARRDPAGEAYRDLKMAHPLLQDIMKAHGAAIQLRESQDGRAEFEMRFALRKTLPVAATEAA
jgi:PAS domain-containing protein